jgi:hypothetical protein
MVSKSTQQKARLSAVLGSLKKFKQLTVSMLQLNV